MVHDPIVNFIGIIPARYASTRFPGKPLALLGDKPIIQHVYEQAKKCLSRVVVATDDERIFRAVQSFGGEVVMTRADHPCGTNRCLEAAEIIGAIGENDVIVNVQGDEPFIQPEQIEAVCSCFGDARCQIATLVKPFTPSDGIEALKNPNSPKVVVGEGKALYFSRSVIPYLRGVEESEWLEEAERRGTPFLKHIGLYAYRSSVLREVVALPVSPLERAESLEQLRWLEAGYTIHVRQTHIQTIGIDTPEDLASAKRVLFS